MSDNHQPELKPGHNPYNKLAATLSKTGALRCKVGRTFTNMTGTNQGTSGPLSKGKGPTCSESPQETTFQPRITDKPATASSSSNWSELKAQQDTDRICLEMASGYPLQISVMRWRIPARPNRYLPEDLDLGADAPVSSESWRASRYL
ncbi:uncharacterized protein PGTG_20666 [Puccinia graminis f. sp. tritici CRL 75-36-700-3]|uniref:Uncharacterized protein n=1 Tax=Puccinia graminis f. sp. tritici (strain CRL 75-36-700-3 / race SCCL) TaxID=418459 RepID=H6QP97_PUCGT|nr:uncharacterized protein PGTG_20666 [Puccinia graminis f. sp. tritici CRL 75-36-700-3]EHS63571.1 hypothetical protein PGTG_20666 [Puccinia graminis f. sp. tritici CRL 75-36-700-3]